MADVSMMNTVQQVAAKWVQSAQTAEAKEAQAVQNPLDFSENNVTMTTSRNRVVSPGGTPQLDTPKAFVSADNAVLLQQNFTSVANSFRAFSANPEQAADLTAAFSQQVETLPAEKRRPVDAALQALTLISDTSNKQRDTMNKISAELNRAQMLKMDKLVEEKEADVKDIGPAVATAVLNCVAGTASSGGELLGKKGKAVSGMVANLSKMAGEVVKSVDGKDDQEKAVEETKSRRQLKGIAAASGAVKGLANKAEDIVDKIGEMRKGVRL